MGQYNPLAEANQYKDEVKYFAQKAHAGLLEDYMYVYGFANDKKGRKKASEKLSLELMAKAELGDRRFTKGIIDDLVPQVYGGFFDNYTMPVRDTHAALYINASKVADRVRGKKPLYEAPTQVDYAAQTKAALDAILATIQNTSAPSINEAESAYLNRKDEVSKLRMRGIGRFIGDQPLSPITSSMTGSLDRKTLGGEDDAT